MTPAPRPPVVIRWVDAPAGHSIRPALDVFARAAGHADFDGLVATATAREQQVEPIGCPS